MRSSHIPVLCRTALLLVSALAGLASAQVNVIVIDNGPVDDPGVPGIQALQRYTVRLEADSPISAFDVELTGTGIWQIQGSDLGTPRPTPHIDSIAGAPQSYLD